VRRGAVEVLNYMSGPRLTTRVFIFIVSVVAMTAVADDELRRSSDYDYEPPVPGSYTLPVVKNAAGGALIDSTGKSVNLSELTHGRITVLSFIYTRCAAPKACPYATNMLGQLHQVSAKDERLARNMRLVSLSFDPEHDTPQQLANYAEAMRETKSGCEWRFATPKTRHELDVILDAYNQVVDKRANPNDPQGPLSHILRVFLIDAQGRVRNIYSSGTLDPRLVLADVKTLMMEPAQPATQ
jgi:protein SCO1/2